MMKFHIVTIFPHIFDSYLGESIMARALARKDISVKSYDPRRHAGNKHGAVDDRPYGGGPGMVLRALPIVRTVEGIERSIARRKHAGRVKKIIFTATGTQFTNEYAEELANAYTDVIMIAGRYEGIDARAARILDAEEVSIGPYVLTGGELPAMVVMDAVTRRLPGVLGNELSVEEARVSCAEVYTRPPVIRRCGVAYAVPDVLLSGDHRRIEAWKRARRDTPSRHVHTEQETKPS